jgi:hypothetical protein
MALMMVVVLLFFPNITSIMTFIAIIWAAFEDVFNNKDVQPLNLKILKKEVGKQEYLRFQPGRFVCFSSGDVDYRLDKQLYPFTDQELAWVAQEISDWSGVAIELVES